MSTNALAAQGILTRTQLANELAIDESTLTTWESQGLPVLRVGRKTRLYDVRAVVKWFRQRKPSGNDNDANNFTGNPP